MFHYVFSNIFEKLGLMFLGIPFSPEILWIPMKWLRLLNNLVIGKTFSNWVSPGYKCGVFAFHFHKQPEGWCQNLWRCPSADEWIRKLWYTYIMEYYSAIKKNTFESVLMRWMKLEPIIQSEVSQKEKHQYSILTHICASLVAQLVKNLQSMQKTWVWSYMQSTSWETLAFSSTSWNQDCREKYQ